jgi:hypothetical protein
MKHVITALLLIIALLLLANVALGYTFQRDCETFVSAADGYGNYEDWRLATQKHVYREDGERYLKCVYRTYETYQGTAAADLTGWRGAN